MGADSFDEEKLNLDQPGPGGLQCSDQANPPRPRADLIWQFMFSFWFLTSRSAQHINIHDVYACG